MPLNRFTRMGRPSIGLLPVVSPAKRLINGVGPVAAGWRMQVNVWSVHYGQAWGVSGPSSEDGPAGCTDRHLLVCRYIFAAPREGMEGDIIVNDDCNGGSLYRDV